jgi:dCMP deaminase
MNWDEYFINIAEQVKLKSKDNNTQIGVVIVGKDNEIVSTGYNSFPRGINDDIDERQEKPEKYFWFEHAERNAIYNAALIGGASLAGCRMYTNGVPCMDCARGIVQAGIEEVIVDAAWESLDKWAENAARTIQMFDETGVALTLWKGQLLDIHKFQRGKIL